MGDLNNTNNRDSNLELFRIVSMLFIVAAHYLNNSGLMDIIGAKETVEAKDIFLLIFGWGGKVGINCFVLITGYFMCKSKISVRKFAKLFAEIEFYSIAIYFVFIAVGYTSFSVAGLLDAIWPIDSVTNGFVPCFLIFYLFIPFLNKLVYAMNEREHLFLGILCICICTILPSLTIDVSISYVTWFSVLFVIGSYLRIYPKPWFENRKLWGWLTIVAVLASWMSIVIITIYGKRFGFTNRFFFVNDSNKILALSTAMCAFMFFKNLEIKQSKLINTISASTFGVLLIHANSDTMRQWLWQDTLNNVSYYNSDLLVFHAVISVIGIYAICTLIDYARIRWLEKPFLNWFDRHLLTKERG